VRDPNPFIAFFEWLVDFLEKYHDTMVFDVLSLIATLLLISFFLAMGKNPASKKHILRFRLSLLPMIAFLIVRLAFA
jgi:hypothetical protein